MSASATRRALVVGYGNPLRSDDGFGWYVAGRLAMDPRLAGCDVLQRQQLTPELALDVSRADVVVLVDARSDAPPGTVAIEKVEVPDEIAGTSAGAGAGAVASSTTWSHHLGPASLVGLARELYGRAGPVHVVSVGVQSLEVGEELSPPVAAAEELVVELVVRLVLDSGAADPTPEAAISHA